MDTLKGEYNELRVKYDKLIRPARSAKGKHVVTVRYRKENGQYLLRIRDKGEYNELRVKYDKLIRPARSAKGKHVVTVRYRKENGQYLLRIRDGSGTRVRQTIALSAAKSCTGAWQS
jgi:anti-sigma regulatory factor (Ser/Thr protein kinase)